MTNINNWTTKRKIETLQMNVSYILNKLDSITNAISNVQTVGINFRRLMDVLKDKGDILDELDENDELTVSGDNKLKFAISNIDLTASLVGTSETFTETELTLPKYVYKNGSLYMVTSISNGAFKGNATLQTVTLPPCLLKIGDSCFESCVSLTTVNIPETVTSIGKRLFYDCIALTTIQKLPNAITTIPDECYIGCRGITAVTFPENITGIGNGSFMHSGLTGKLTLSPNIKTLGDDAFKETKITELDFGIDSRLTSIGASCFESCTELSGRLFIPDATVRIGNTAFAKCSGITEMQIPNSLQFIEENAFEGFNNSIIVNCEDGPEHITRIFYTKQMIDASGLPNEKTVVVKYLTVMNKLNVESVYGSVRTLTLVSS